MATEGMEEENNENTSNVIPSSPVMDITPSLDALGSSTSGHQGTPSSGTTECTTHSSSQTTPHATPCHMQWSSSLEPLTVAPFSENVGPTFSVPSSPKAVLNHFLTDSICEMVVTQSNLFAQQVMGEEKYAAWEKITVDELRAFFGLRILMGIVKFPAMAMYWSKDTALNQPEITSRISRNRFQDLTRYLHFANSSTLPERGQSGHDRLGKVRPIINALQERFLLNYSPNRDQAVDEAMLPFQGRSSLKQYLPAKHVKRGIKYGAEPTHTTVTCGRSPSGNREVNLGGRVARLGSEAGGEELSSVL